jgi:hypothetical protein
MSSGLFLVKLNHLRRRGDCWRPGQWVFIPLGAQRSVMGGTAALTWWYYHPHQNSKDRQQKAWLFCLGYEDVLVRI